MSEGNLKSGSLKRHDVASLAIKGARSYQEDALIVSFPMGQSPGFAIVADGVGGHAAGNVASAIVAGEVFSTLKMEMEALAHGYTGFPAVLRDAANSANDRVRQFSEDHPETYGMGSTLLAIVVQSDRLWWVSVGDSPLFLYRGDTLHQLNEDHSMGPHIDMMVRLGEMDPEVGRDHPARNALTSIIGGGPIPEIDCPDQPFVLVPGDIVIAATDGLQFLSDAEIAMILDAWKNSGSVAIARALLAGIEELASPEQDNTAFVVIKGLEAGSDA